MNQILSNIQKVVDDSVLLFTLKVSEKYNVDQNELYDLWKEMCGNDDCNMDDVVKQNKRQIKKKKIPKAKKVENKSPLEKKSISELKKMCKECGLKKYSTLKKKQLVELLQQNEEENKKEDPPLEDVLDDVLEDNAEDNTGDNAVQDVMEKIENMEIENKEKDFNEEEIVEEY